MLVLGIGSILNGARLCGFANTKEIGVMVAFERDNKIFVLTLGEVEAMIDWSLVK